MIELTYRIISASNADDLCKRVNDEIRLGWEPIGGVMVAQQLCDRTKQAGDPHCTLYSAGLEFHQAMIKRP